jgi:transposase
LKGILRVLHTGTKWGQLAERYGRWNSVYVRFARWTRAGVWESLLAVMIEAGGPPDLVQRLDGTIVRAHQHAAGAKGAAVSRRSDAREAGSRPRSTSAATVGAARSLSG